MRPEPLVIIALLVIALAFTAASVIRLENYRYANFVGYCADYDSKDPVAHIKREDCLNEKQTRTIWLWHVIYGLNIF